MQIEGLDELDNTILTIIKDDARLTYKEIGERAGISRVSVKARIDALEKKGIIKGYKTVIDEEAVGGGTRFFLDVECAPEHYEDVVEYLAGNRMVREICSVSGECRIHAEGYAANTKNLEYLSNAIFRGGLGVRRISCHTVLSVMMDKDGGVDYVRYQEPEHLENGK